MSNDAVGCLMYLMVATRPDIAVAVGVASQFLENPGQQHWSAVKCIFRYLKGTEDFGIEYSGSQDVCGYTDADWAGDTDTRHSTNGYCFMLNNGIVGWKSRKQRTDALSSTEAEYMGLSEASQEAVWMKRLLLDLDEVDVKTPIVVWEDNQGSIALAKNPQSHETHRYSLPLCGRESSRSRHRPEVLPNSKHDCRHVHKSIANGPTSEVANKDGRQASTP
ncbi:hypothetical protein Ae201684P_021887 [Aphanomyces euteiches]|uniref:Reverse transcriptase Ty1/copia-type domain-containing protein n=1 Tax=Aphanomyces euteiches TaxID=100861 RepID=A0A6G0WSN2_9STRA|nr:hypothetical protein Ae201684_012167 [Aphanomyces euteiches]KAH9056145.1 hypothetical protein Ae201684P_021882 [Aphanomyces euteiches]KAH9056150.1 hypothetical protein Ae201684P_021887 [Aphanomyces euteiches]